MSETPNLPAVHELDRRRADALVVTLWWVEGTLSTYVQVVDERSGEDFIVATPPDAKSTDVFMHPYAYRAAEERNNA